MSKIPLYKYNIIYLHYKDKILTGEYNPGDKLPSEMEIAKKFNVSRITATRALNELESSELIYRVKGSGSYVNEGNWKENTSDNNYNKDAVSIISLVLPFSRNQFSSELQVY